MKVNIRKVVKPIVFGWALYHAVDFAYDVGKGRMLGTLAKDNNEIAESLKQLSEYRPEKLSERLKIKTVLLTASLTKEEP